MYPDYKGKEGSVTISLDRYKELEQIEKNMELYFNDGGVLEIEWYNTPAKYISEKDFDKTLVNRVEKEVLYSKTLKKVLNELSRMSILKFLKFKKTYSYSSLYP